MDDKILKPKKISFEEMYDDQSGVEFSVKFDGSRLDDEIKITHIDTVYLPVNKLDWLIERLKYIKDNAEFRQVNES